MPAQVGCSLTKQEIIDLANSIRQQYFTANNPVVGIRNFLMEKKGKIQISDGEESESLKLDSDGKFTITIPESSSSVRDVFTIAHEIGHYYLHTNHLAPGAAAFNRKGANLTETQANWFAAELLMPEQEFRTIANKYKNDKKKIAAHFGVSGAAANIRMVVLGLV